MSHMADADEEVPELLRVVTPPDPTQPIYAHHPHAGMIICRQHLDQIRHDEDSTCEVVPPAQVAFWRHRCLMCGVRPVAGRLCLREDCEKPLHPQWPAVYCSNLCALLDA